MEQAKLSTGARYLKRGDTFDIEDFRMTHRLGVARGILRNLGIEPEWAPHSPKCYRICGGVSSGQMNCDYATCERRRQEQGDGPTWPEWVTNDIFNAAFRLADEVQTERGAWNRNADVRARRLEREKEAAQ